MPPEEPTLYRKIEAAARWLRNNAPLILLTFAAGALVFAPVWLENLQNPDSAWIGVFYRADHWEYLADWEVRQGRWALTLMGWLRRSMQDSAVLTRLPALLLFAVGAQLAADLLELRSRWARLLAPLLMVCNPCVLEILTYRYCCADYGLSYLLAVAAVAAVVRLPGVGGIVTGTLCLTFSLGLYQAHLGLAAALCMMIAALRLLRQSEGFYAVMRLFGRMACMGGAGVALYYLILRLSLGVKGLEMTSYSGADNFGAAHILTSLPSGVGRAYLSAGRFFFGESIVANHYGMCALYLLLFALGGAALLLRLWMDRTERAKRSTAMALLFVVLLPMALSCMILIIPESVPMPRTSMALLLMLPFLLALVEQAPPFFVTRLARGLCVAGAFGLLWADTLQNVTDTQVMSDRKALYRTVAQQVYADLRVQDGYTTDTAVLVAGQLPNENYPDPTRFAEYADFVAGSPFSWPGGLDANSYCWRNFFREELGLALNWGTVEENAAIQQTEEYQAMPCYPDPGAFAWFEGEEGRRLLIVKLSPV